MLLHKAVGLATEGKQTISTFPSVPDWAMGRGKQQPVSDCASVQRSETQVSHFEILMYCTKKQQVPSPVKTQHQKVVF